MNANMVILQMEEFIMENNEVAEELSNCDEQ